MKNRFSWLIAIVSLALWTLAPTSWQQAIQGHLNVMTSHQVQLAWSDDLGPGSDFWSRLFGNSTGSDAGGLLPPCGPASTPTSIAPVVPNAVDTPVPTVTPSNNSSGQATFHLCGSPDPQTQQAIAQLIAGRGFSATLVGRADGCADLTITVSPNSSARSGRQTSNLSVSSNSGGTRRTISVQITSENGTTQVTIGPGN